VCVQEPCVYLLWPPSVVIGNSSHPCWKGVHDGGGEGGEGAGRSAGGAGDIGPGTGVFTGGGDEGAIGGEAGDRGEAGDGGMPGKETSLVTETSPGSVGTGDGSEGAEITEGSEGGGARSGFVQRGKSEQPQAAQTGCKEAREEVHPPPPSPSAAPLRCTSSLSSLPVVILI
jgi:hypothetical protein